MAVTVDEVVVSLVARIGKYEADLRRAEQSFASFNRNLETKAQHSGNFVTHHFDEMGRHIARSLAVLAGVEGLKRLGESVVRAAENADKLRSLAELIGITTDQLQGLRLQAERFGSSADEMSQGLVYFTRQVGLAASGSGDLLKVLNANHVSLKDSNGEMKSASALLATYSDLIKNATDEQARLVLTTIGFGRGSAELATTFAGGSKANAEFLTHVRETGQVIQDDVLKQLADMQPIIQAIGNKWEVVWDRAIIASEGFFDKVFRQSADFQLWLEQMGTNRGLAQPRDPHAAPSGRFGPGFNKNNSAIVPGQSLEDAKARARAEIIRQMTVRDLIAPLKDDKLLPAGTNKSDGSTILPNLGGPTEADQARKRWDEAAKSIAAETAVLKANAETVDKSRFVQEKALAVQQLMNDAIRAGVEITPALTAQIDTLATAHANAVVHLENLQEAQDKLVERIDAFKDASKDVLHSFIDDLRAGKGASEALYNALQNIESKLEDMVLSGLFDALFGTSGKTPANRGGLLNSILGSLFSGFTGQSMPGASSGGGIGSMISAGPGNISSGRAAQAGSSRSPVISFEPQIVPPPGMETNIESVSDGRGGQKPKVFFTQVVQAGLRGRNARQAAGLGTSSFRRGG